MAIFSPPLSHFAELVWLFFLYGIPGKYRHGFILHGFTRDL